MGSWLSWNSNRMALNLEIRLLLPPECWAQRCAAKSDLHFTIIFLPQVLEGAAISPDHCVELSVRAL